ncbi:MAG: biotin--[acetyl-CoA-carboxylase] ligase [Methanothrix sp.]|nr:MAG: biotin--[acetyl-CoA-carboxylase] ligase [Methanothrix sp.]
MAAEEILSFLHSGEWVSGEEMAARLGISRAAVWKQIRSLRKRGYEIESSTKKGYRLAGNHDILDADLIRSGLKTQWLGKDLRCFSVVTSTNEVARTIALECRNDGINRAVNGTARIVKGTANNGPADAPANNGTVILAEVQTQGRGRLSRSWASPPGGVWMSLILRPQISLDRAYRINMAISVAICKALADLYGLAAGVKWPNDLLIEEKKICGILMEVSAEVDRLEYVVVGIGINANVDVSGYPAEWRSTSLHQELGREVSRVGLIQKILLEIENSYQHMDSKEIWEEWRNRSVTLGRQVRISSVSGDIVGEAADLAEDGALIIQSRDQVGLHRVLAGDCIHLRALEAA